MIATAMVDEIRHLLAERRLSQRTIARRLGVSRGTVNAIALGRRAVTSYREAASREDFPPPAGPPRRCPGCGGLVQMPCLLCRVRALKRR